MTYIKTSDNTKLYVKDWNKEDRPVIFMRGSALIGHIQNHTNRQKRKSGLSR